MLKVGDRVIVKMGGTDLRNPNRSGHQYVVGKEYTVVRYIPDANAPHLSRVYLNENPTNCYCFEAELELVAVSIEALQLKAKKIQEKVTQYYSYLNQVEQQIKWMQDTKAETFDSETYRIHTILTMFNKTDLDEQSKVRMLKELLNPKVELPVNDPYGTAEEF